jgi:sugar phosphate isomerase/epimerase
MPRPISLAHLTVLELSPPAMIRVAAETGYASVDLRLAPATPTDTDWPVFGDTPMRREVQALLADTGVSVYDVEIIRVTRETDAADYERLFEAAARLGARRCKVIGVEPDESLIAAKLAELCRVAAPYRLTVDLEFVSFLGIRSIDAAARVVKAAGQPNGNLLVDALHLSRSGGKPEDVAALRGRMMGYVQLCDAVAAVPPDDAGKLSEARGDRLAPGEGALPLVELLGAVPAHFPISLEVPMLAKMSAAERARRSIEGMKRLLEKAAAS